MREQSKHLYETIPMYSFLSRYFGSKQVTGIPDTNGRVISGSKTHLENVNNESLQRANDLYPIQLRKLQEKECRCDYLRYTILIWFQI